MTQLTAMTDAVDSAHQQKTPRRGSRAMTTAAGSHAVARSLATALAIGVALTAATVDVAASSAETHLVRNGPIAFREVAEDGLGGPLQRMRPDGTRLGVIDSRPGFFHDLRPDGRRIAFDFFEPDGDEQIATARPDGSDVRVITSGHGIHEVPSWSPDGQRIVFNASPVLPDAPGFETRLWTMRADGSDARRLPMTQPGFDVEPRWSPDGRSIVFTRLRPQQDGEEASAVMIVPAAGGRHQRLTSWDQGVEHPTWSTDGRWIAYGTPEGTILAVRPDGSGRRTIRPALDGVGSHKPRYSPDGKRIVFMCENQGLLSEPPAGYNEDICTMNPDGTGVINLTNTPDALENWPSWGAAPPSYGRN
jgi:Tol biopolymer transport system component